MKKALLTLLLASSTLVSAWAGKPEKLQTLAKQYRHEEGFEMVSLGRLGMSLLRGAISLSGDLDEEDRIALKIFSGLKKLIIIDFEDIPAAKKQAFGRRVEQILEGMQLIMEAKDGSESLQIYGEEDGESIRDCILYSSDGTLIVTKGRFDPKHLDELMDIAQ